ncbi:delta(14)-sterol reductase TM7SF2 [Leptopilina heterotoma]|uniref:delta(14)-sterol reductase TM7SF2 n=1 Tax=Leptopilina heterotoma TaxID=63436 RepID=UPI001CA8BBA6|nr:delta(14)-sterol reductase TM7SF2 [Leptopilina heterotoma]
MKFIEGEEVLAKQPNTSEFQKGKVVNVKGTNYQVQFKGGSKFLVKEADMKPTRTSRSATRTRGQVKKSPSRNSPSRRSPSRRSPGRLPNQSRKLTARSSRLIQISDDERKEGSSEASGSIQDDDSDVIPLQSRIREGPQLTRRSIRIMSNVAKAEQEQRLIALTRTIDRAASLPTERNAQAYDSIRESKERGFSMIRDSDLKKSALYEDSSVLDTVVPEKHKKEVDLLSKPQEWGGWFGVLLLMFIGPVSILLPQIACSRERCSMSKFRFSKDIKSYLNANVFLLYAGYLLFVSIMSLVPIGWIVEGQQTRVGRLKYRINGLLTGILVMIAYGVAEYKGYQISSFILNNSVEFTLVGLIYGTILSIVLYIKGGRASVANLNIHATTNNHIYDFWQGRETNPRFGPLDIKFNFIRATLIGSIIVSVAVIVKIFQGSQSLSLETLNLTALIAASLQILYVLDGLIFESAFLSSFEVAYEGTGFMLCFGYLMYPFVCTLPARFALYNKVSQSPYILALLVVCYSIGHGIYRYCNSQKDEFRRNPLSPRLARLETIPTVRGKRLIVSGIWGYVRHPNYLGDIILHWSIAGLIVVKDLLPYYNAIFLTLMLIYRSIRDNRRCQQRYGLAWEEYCSRVKYMIIKRIF